MAKTRAQRKAERARRRAELQRKGELDPTQQREQESHAQHDTQLPVSGEVAEAEAVMESGARPEDYGETVAPERDQPGPDPDGGSPVPGVLPGRVRPEQEIPESPAPSRADVGQPDAETLPQRESRDDRRVRKEREKEERRRARAKELQKGGKAVEPQKEERRRRRGPVSGFIASCWAELKRVQWPDRQTLVQASAVTLIFVAVCAAYLGALDAAFNWLIQRIL